MSGWRVAAMIVGAVLTVCDAAPADNVLDGIRNEVNESSSKGDDDSSSSVGSRNSDFWDDDDDDESFSNFLLRGVLSSPFTVPVLVTGDDYDAWAAFPAAPFDRHDGYLILDSESAIERSWGGRFALDTGGNFDDVAALTGRLQLETSSRFGLDGSWTQFHEKQRKGWDSLSLGDANVTFRFAQSETLQFNAGLGMNWMADHGDFDTGLNLTYGFDWFPAKPLVVSSSLDLGTLGSAGLFRSTTTVGVMVNRFEIFGGFDYLNVEGVDVPMGISGLRIWY